MSWGGFFRGSTNVLRIVALILVKIILLVLNLAFMAFRFVLFVFMFMLTLGRIGISTTEMGGRRR